MGIAILGLAWEQTQIMPSLSKNKWLNFSVRGQALVLLTSQSVININNKLTNFVLCVSEDT